MDGNNIALAIERAGEVRRKAYAPYSGLSVGAAVIDASGNMYVGCNVENASYGLTQCAERNAVAAATAAGHRDISVCIVIADTEEPITPCGACRQVLAECNLDMHVVCATTNGVQDMYILRDLLPKAFTL
jgi:cytidine deaminase